MTVLGRHEIKLRGTCHSSDDPTEVALIAGEGHVRINVSRPWFSAGVALSYGDLLRFHDQIGIALAAHGPKPITVESLGGAEQTRVACPCGWDDDGELHVTDIRHPDGFAVHPPAGSSPLTIYGDEGQAAGSECPDCGRDIRIGTVVARRSVVA